MPQVGGGKVSQEAAERAAGMRAGYRAAKQCGTGVGTSGDGLSEPQGTHRTTAEGPSGGSFVLS